VAKAITVKGDKAVVKAFQALPKKVRNQVAKPIVRREAKAIAAAAKANMPADSGVARKSITVRIRKKKKRGTVFDNVIFKADKIRENSWQRKRATKQAAASDSADPKPEPEPEGHFYPATIEYGSVKLGRPAVAPLRRAYDSEGPAAAKRTERDLAGGVEKAAAELNRS
jgi:hypothetical protein